MAQWIAGAGGVGREALDVAVAAEVPIAGFIDDALAGGSVGGLAVQGPGALSHGDRFIVAIGDPVARLEVAARLSSSGGLPMTLVHPRAVLAADALLEGGCLVMALAHLSSAVRLEPHAQVHYGATVGHDTVLGEGAIVLPGANVAGSVQLEHGVMVGSGAVVLQGLVVGAGSVVGAGAVVTRDVEPGSVVVGSPARPLNR